MLSDLIEDIIEMVTYKVVISAIVAAITIYMWTDSPDQKKEQSDAIVANNKPTISIKNERSPSSLTSQTSSIDANKPTVKVSSFDQSNFEPQANFENEQSQNNSNLSVANSITNHLISNPALNVSEKKMNNPLDVKPKPQASETIQNTKTDSKKSEDKKTATATTPSTQNSSSSHPIDNSCSSNIVSGSFGNPIGVRLACLYPSTIKFCLSQNVCCDPETQGKIYTTKVIVGKKNGTYCLSFSADSETGGSTIIYQQNYTINSTFPNLQVGHTKTFYQTTELIGESFISSQDFGKPNFSAGQINLKGNDPGSAGLNYTCDDIIANYVNLSTPAPTEILGLFDISGLLKNSQIEIPLRADQLDYGDNFVTSYIQNNNYTTPLYSCATTKVNLDDFEYFQADVAQAGAGTNTVREFEGGFSSYGFFEEQATVFRGPAGESSVEKTGENLKSGLFAVFY